MPNRHPGLQPGLPRLTPYLPPAGPSSSPAVLICPGGGYGMLCDSYEGHAIARWLVSFGIAGLVLEYRHAPYRHPTPWLDATQAMRFIRAHADLWRLDPRRLGIMGFSAGGHLAGTVATHWDTGNAQAEAPIGRQSSRPDFQLLIYPVITFLGDHVSVATRDNLLGTEPPDSLLRDLSLQHQVTAQTPPCFLVHSCLDSVVPVQNSRLYAEALHQHGVSVDYVELSSGDHGLGLGRGPEWTAWQSQCQQWLQRHVCGTTSLPKRLS